MAASARRLASWLSSSGGICGVAPVENHFQAIRIGERGAVSGRGVVRILAVSDQAIERDQLVDQQTVATHVADAAITALRIGVGMNDLIALAPPRNAWD